MILKLSTLIVAAICLAAAATGEPNLNDNFLLAQKTVLDLYWHVDQPEKVHPEIYKLGTSWDIAANIDLYTDKAVVKEFLEYYKYESLPRGRTFSIFHPKLVREAKILFKLFYHAKDMQTFLNTAAWARIHMNEEMFIYVLTVAVIHRPDTLKIRLPLPYEIMPNLYFNSEIMQQAYDYKMALNPHVKDASANPQVFYAQLNCTKFTYELRDPEFDLSYYLEDLDLNAFYYYFNQEYPFWMSSEKYDLDSEMRGEFYYWIHKVLMNRYNHERLSHGLGKVETFDWDRPIATGFNPSITLRNGMRLPSRPQWASIPPHHYEYLRMVKDFEARLTQSIGYGFVLTKSGPSQEKFYNRTGLSMLANMIEGNADSVNYEYYGSIDRFARAIFGFSPESQSQYDFLPGGLDYYSTSLRDPGFYRIYNRIMTYFGMFKKHLPMYTHERLNFEGVKLESVAIDKMYTFFDYSDAVISGGVKVHDHHDAESILIKARQLRLNHKAFSYHFTINSDKDQKASVRIFIGPKYNVYGKKIDISENYDNFYEIDYFITDLKSGINKIERKSTEATFTIPDQESSDSYYKKVVEALESGADMAAIQKRIGFPQRLILPKGLPEGLPVQFFFFVSKFDEGSSRVVKSRLWGEWRYDDEAFGFPLDRPVLGFNFTTSNMLFKDANIFHKERDESNLTN